MEFCAGEEWRQLVQDVILPVALNGIDLGAAVIEIGPGPGFTTDVLKGLTASLTAVEIDPGLARALADRLRGGNVDVVLGDATALDMPAATFTGAASFHMLHHIGTVDDQQRALSELARVLQPGGVLVAADAGYSDGSRLFHEGDTYNPIEPDSLAPRLAEVGFTSVEVREYDLGWVCLARAV
jgi:ubiquinone/menaquinone biosynthesis C-methylase UbiE